MKILHNYIEVKNCRCCGSTVETLLDLNEQPLANSYHDNDTELEKFPLKLNLCNNCYHLQLSVVVNSDLMFKNYLYVSGTTNSLKEYFKFFAQFTIDRFEEKFNYKPKTVLDIACNDGTQLDYYKNNNIETYGVDPAENLLELSSKSHNVICDYFPSEKLNRKFNLITAQNVFAHTHYVVEFLENCKSLLEDEGIIYIQTSQANMILNNEFDTTYHEHLSFFNSKSMKTLVERCGLELNNIYKFDIHGTSYVFEISKSKIDGNVEETIESESNSGLYDINTYKIFADNAKSITNDLKETINKYKSKGYSVIGYGAAAKGMTLLNFGKINMDYIIDDNDLKKNLHTPGMNIPIKGISIINDFDKVVFVPLAWNFYNEIYKRIKTVRDNQNDLFIKYFPKINILK
jgi:2-polyprenyl-3-methyl-5-hydroxy-6-metoxy-1,4-benzoquinol methylase